MTAFEFNIGNSISLHYQIVFFFFIFFTGDTLYKSV